MGEGTLCPACGTLKGFTKIDKVNNYSIFRCPDCGLEFSEPMASPRGEWYDKAYTIRHFALDSRINDCYRWVVTSIPAKGKLLDFGCGEGVFVNYARVKGFDAYGIDFSQEAIKLGRLWYRLETIYNCSLLEVKKITGCSEGFDIVTCFEVLEHLENPWKFIEEVKTVLKPGGYIAGSVPFNNRWPFREFNDYPPHHLTRWTETSMRRLFERSGFDTVQIKTGTKFRSLHIFLTYLVRIWVYKMFGMYSKGCTGEKEIPNAFKNTQLRRFITAIRPRMVRDIVLWPLAVFMYPLVFWWFKGYNMMFIVKRKN